MQKDLKRNQKTSFKIRNVKIADLAGVVKLFDLQLGKNYITEKCLKEATKSRRTFCKVVEDLDQSKVVGACIYSIVSYNEAKSLIREMDIAELESKSQIGLIKTVAVDDNYKNMGVGTNLISTVIKELNSKGISEFFSPAWKFSGITNIAHILERNGFSKKLKFLIIGMKVVCVKILIVQNVATHVVAHVWYM